MTVPPKYVEIDPLESDTETFEKIKISNDIRNDFARFFLKKILDGFPLEYYFSSHTNCYQCLVNGKDTIKILNDPKYIRYLIIDYYLDESLKCHRYIDIVELEMIQFSRLVDHFRALIWEIYFPSPKKCCIIL